VNSPAFPLPADPGQALRHVTVREAPWREPMELLAAFAEEP